jgi:hypothetical protein
MIFPPYQIPFFPQRLFSPPIASILLISKMAAAAVPEPNPLATMKLAEPNLELHAQELDLEKLDRFASMSLENPDETAVDSASSSLQKDDNLKDDCDDILPDESFSAQPSPEASLVNGHSHTTPPISIFEKTSASPIKPDRPSSVSMRDRKKDDIPIRYSDVEDSPLLKPSDFPTESVTFDEFNSDEEWGPVPEMTGLPPQFISQVQKKASPSIAEEKKKRKKKNKKTKGVYASLVLLMAD